eukprot:CAMPEP_0206534292 /NCGR_PEP_ID=MMETSP0325_2-20121206/5464_1 /ASSEMBLY_ACC=CAM_ASM_000347 /TAXON_ID=2866 /ORGANISM="Crypthecodinium cohnii, Strain Seligo" /LENGTH=747 /DNA_ID=CAMNT_0054031079 /DNA_START=416 /DNA_END=2656 /DNA_ORIENTATION=-
MSIFGNALATVQTAGGQALEAVSGAAQQAKNAIDQQTGNNKPKTVPCFTCSGPTRNGDGGACGDLVEAKAAMPVKVAPPAGATNSAPAKLETGETQQEVQAMLPKKPRCRSCLTEEEIAFVKAHRSDLQDLLNKTLAGKEEKHEEPEESRVEMAHRLGSLALSGALDVLGLIPGVPVNAIRGTKVLHGIVQYGPLALYQGEVKEALSLMSALISSSGVVPTGEDPDAPAGPLEQAASSSSMQAMMIQKKNAANHMSELTAALYYLLVERRNAAGLDPVANEREHSDCAMAEAKQLQELLEVHPLACNIAYAQTPAEAQRLLRLAHGQWQMAFFAPQGRGGQPPFIFSIDRSAKRAAVLIPGTQTAADVVTDLNALPVRVNLGKGYGIGWAHRGMIRQASAIVRLVGNLLMELENQGYKLFFAGHSLGAGVAALAGLVLRLGLEENYKCKSVRSFCYATPACGNFAVGRYCEGHATTIVNCDDVVPRLSLETARKLRAELDGKRELVRQYVAEDVAAMQNVQNITEKKRRKVPVEGADQVGSELQSLQIPAPKEKPSENASILSTYMAPAGPRQGPKAGLLSCFGLCGKAPLDEAEVEDEGDDKDPSQVKLYPPGKILHLYRSSGMRRAAWISRRHPSLHRIEVMYGLVEDHSGVSYKNGLNEAIAYANGKRPTPWKPYLSVPRCSCCDSDFHWASVLASQPHRLQARNHCHACGNVVCDGCSQKTRPFPELGILREVRICDKCDMRG